MGHYHEIFDLCFESHIISFQTQYKDMTLVNAHFLTKELIDKGYNVFLA